jgi:hypothetical protein
MIDRYSCVSHRKRVHARLQAWFDGENEGNEFSGVSVYVRLDNCNYYKSTVTFVEPEINVTLPEVTRDGSAGANAWLELYTATLALWMEKEHPDSFGSVVQEYVGETC